MATREGPEVRVELRCFDCVYVSSERYVKHNDSGYNVSCNHPEIGKRQIGDTSWTTPCWCPFLTEAMKQAAEKLNAGLP